MTTLRAISASLRFVQIEASHQFRVRGTRSNCGTNILPSRQADGVAIFSLVPST